MPYGYSPHASRAHPPTGGPQPHPRTAIARLSRRLKNHFIRGINALMRTAQIQPVAYKMISQRGNSRVALNMPLTFTSVETHESGQHQGQ